MCGILENIAIKHSSTRQLSFSWLGIAYSSCSTSCTKKTWQGKGRCTSKTMCWNRTSCQALDDFTQTKEGEMDIIINRNYCKIQRNKATILIGHWLGIVPDYWTKDNFWALKTQQLSHERCTWLLCYSCNCIFPCMWMWSSCLHIMQAPLPRKVTASYSISTPLLSIHLTTKEPKSKSKLNHKHQHQISNKPQKKKKHVFPRASQYFEARVKKKVNREEILHIGQTSRRGQRKLSGYTATMHSWVATQANQSSRIRVSTK